MFGYLYEYPQYVVWGLLNWEKLVHIHWIYRCLPWRRPYPRESSQITVKASYVIKTVVFWDTRDKILIVIFDLFSSRVLKIIWNVLECGAIYLYIFLYIVVKLTI
jgi:hypothetical protein